MVAERENVLLHRGSSRAISSCSYGEKRPAQICREHNLAESVVSRWRKEDDQRGEEAFLPPTSSEPPTAEARLAELERICSQLALENALPKKALGKLPLNSDMR